MLLVILNRKIIIAVFNIVLTRMKNIKKNCHEVFKY